MTTQVRLKALTICLLLFTSIGSASAQLRLPALFADGMVLQQKDSVQFWGWAGPGETVTIKPSWTSQVYTAKSSYMSQWITKVKTPEAGGPYTIEINSRNTIILKDVLIGEVWVCSGQSNMEWSYYNGVSDMNDQFALPPNKNIRLFHINKVGSNTPQDDVKASWTITDSNTMKGFSAVGYFFGKKLQEQLNVPIGLIGSAWGGTPADTWTPSPIIENNPVFKADNDKLNQLDWWPVRPAQAYNGMIAPISKYGIAGVIWYQGESNVGNHANYRQLFTTMIDAWRTSFKNEMPFYFVQIAPFNYGPGEDAAHLRQAQTASMTHPKTGMVVVNDLVDTVSDIHPKRKRPVGERLAAWALANTYGKQGIVYRSPEFKSATKLKGKVTVEFDFIGSGIQSSTPKITGFYLAGADGVWQPADAVIKDNKVILSSKLVKDPTQVHYLYGNALLGSVQSKDGLPLNAFKASISN